jgi:hypothetical protein
MTPRKLLRAAFGVFAALVAGAGAAQYAQREFDFGDLHLGSPIAYGVVEHVQEVPLDPDPDSDPSGLGGVFEHPVKPETASQVAIQLDDGRPLIVMHDGTERFESGQRVQVVFTTDGVRVDSW